ncbi:MAG TPA: general stress protein [Herpetosiphonaceae bacterium]|nr:general stress protein [Herpetosiphonaceae bacterium]
MEQQILPDRQRLRRAVASYASYAEAQRAVDYLSDQKFPVQRVAIFAEGLRFVEQVTGRLGYGQAMLNGALSGAVTGAFLGYLLGLFSLVTPLTSGLVLGFYGLIFGAIIGAIIGLIGHALSGGRRDFSSTSGLQAERYNVMVDDDLADEAARLLAGMAGPAVAAERAGAQGQAV